MKDGLYTFEELSQYMDKAKEPLSELVKATQEREKFWHSELNKSQSKVEEMQKVIDTAVMFLQGNELFIKAEQIKAMSQALKGVSNE